MSSSTSTNPAQFPTVELVEKLAAATINVVLGFKQSGPKDWTFQRVKLRDGLPDQFRTRATEAATDLRDNRAARAYDPEWELAATEYFYVSNSPPIGGNFFPRAGNLTAMPGYKPGKRSRKPQVWLIVAQLDDELAAWPKTRRRRPTAPCAWK
jgi:hypothetical protein